MTDWTSEYSDADGSNERYRLLKAEMARLRGRRDAVEYFDVDAVGRDLSRLAESVDGDLLAFVANDFGRPRAYRPEGFERDRQDAVRRGILDDKYDDANDDLNAIRRDLLDAHSGIHKALVAEYRDGDADGEFDVRYHLPEGSTDETNFLTVREMVGLVDYTTNSFQRDGLSVTY